MKLAALLLLFAAIVLSRGFWHMRTHATLRVNLDGDAASPAALRETRVSLLDGTGKHLASLTGDPEFGVLQIVEPADFACTRTNRGADWQRCFRRQSRWISEWGSTVAFADVAAPGCAWPRQPARPQATPDEWWLWWVPLPHVGGDPYTNYDLRLRGDRRECLSRPSAAAR